jgi:hypothetical protein
MVCLASFTHSLHSLHSFHRSNFIFTFFSLFALVTSQGTYAQLSETAKALGMPNKPPNMYAKEPARTAVAMTTTASPQSQSYNPFGEPSPSSRAAGGYGGAASPTQARRPSLTFEQRKAELLAKKRASEQKQEGPPPYSRAGALCICSLYSRPRGTCFLFHRAAHLRVSNCQP